MTARTSCSRLAAVAILGVALAVIATFLTFEYVLGYQPCPLCLYQRVPFYIGAPLALLVALPPSLRWRRAGLLALLLVFLVSAGLGVWHAGVEWKFWPGPAGCSGQGAPQSAADLLGSLQKIRIVSCVDAAWRFLGLSMAGWNVLVSLGLSAIAAAGAICPTRLRGKLSP